MLAFSTYHREEPHQYLTLAYGTTKTRMDIGFQAIPATAEATIAALATLAPLNLQGAPKRGSSSVPATATPALR